MDNKTKGNLNTTKNNDDSDLMRFGHTVTLGKFIFYLVNRNNALLFGGAKGTSGNYTILDDTYSFKINDKIWIKLNRKKLF